MCVEQVLYAGYQGKGSGFKLTFSCGLETHGHGRLLTCCVTSLIAASYKTLSNGFSYGTVSRTLQSCTKRPGFSYPGMPLPAATAAKHSCATTTGFDRTSAEVKILHLQGTVSRMVGMPTPIIYISIPDLRWRGAALGP